MPADVGIAPARVDGFLIKAASDVLERMFFTEIEVTGTDGSVEMARPVCVDVRFSGPLSGALRLRLEEEAARCLGLTLTCFEVDEFPRDRCVQLTGELANMICGCLLSKLEPEANLALSTPEQAADGPAMNCSVRRWFALPEGVLLAEFALDQPPYDDPV